MRTEFVSAWEGGFMERTFGENWRNAIIGVALTVAVVGGGLAAAFLS